MMTLIGLITIIVGWCQQIGSVRQQLDFIAMFSVTWYIGQHCFVSIVCLCYFKFVISISFQSFGSKFFNLNSFS